MKLLAPLVLLASITTTSAKKPNVIIIFADDVGTGDVPGYWNTGLVDMPNLEDLVANGVTFTDAHSTPFCAPSRYVLLSGNYPHRGHNPTGTWTSNYDFGNQFLPGQKSIANVFLSNGYSTSMYGKWHLGGKIPTYSNFTKSKFSYIERLDMATKFAISSNYNNWNMPLKKGPWDVGFQQSYITLAGIQAPPYAFLQDGKFQEQDLINVKHWEKGTYNTTKGQSKIILPGDGAEDWDSTMYNSILVQKTKNFVRNHMKTKPDSPFFTYVALGSVHVPHTPPFEYLDGTLIAGQHATKHMDGLKEMDKVVGSLVDVLKEQGVLEDTIICFASDNGGLSSSRKHGHFSSGRLRGHKGSIYEGGHRIPLIIRWDNGMIPKGERRTHLVGLNDVFTTLTDLAQIRTPYGNAHDSISFASYAKNQNNRIGLRNYLGTWRFIGTDLLQSALRKGSMKIVYDHKTKSTELYDLSEDISEENNIANKMPGLVNEMKSYLIKISPCYENPGMFRVKFKWGAEARSPQRRRCKWFREKKKRCYQTHDGIVHCARSCSINKRFCDDNQLIE